VKTAAGFALFTAAAAAFLTFAGAADPSHRFSDPMPLLASACALPSGFLAWKLMKGEKHWARAAAAGALVPPFAAVIGALILSPGNLPLIGVGLILVGTPLAPVGLVFALLFFACLKKVSWPWQRS